jgi:Methylamine utilisation protein MauE
VVNEALLPLLAIAAGVMLLAGLAKLRSPASAQEAISAFGLPPSLTLVRALGGTEVCIGALCLVAPGPIALIALASAYLVFAAAIGARWLRGERQVPCGCFGDSSVPTHLGHLAMNLVCAAVALAALVKPPPSLTTTFGYGLPALTLLVGIGCSVYLIFALLTLLPDSWRAYSAGQGDRAA